VSHKLQQISKSREKKLCVTKNVLIGAFIRVKLSCFIFVPQASGVGCSYKSNINLISDVQIGLRFHSWDFDNGRSNKGWVKNFSGLLTGPRDHKLMGPFFKIVDF